MLTGDALIFLNSWAAGAHRGARQLHFQLTREGSDWAAFVAENGKAVKRRAEIGQHSGLSAQVLSGGREGERVLVHPDDRVRDGASVIVRQERWRQCCCDCNFGGMLGGAVTLS